MNKVIVICLALMFVGCSPDYSDTRYEQFDAVVVWDNDKRDTIPNVTHIGHNFDWMRVYNAHLYTKGSHRIVGEFPREQIKGIFALRGDNLPKEPILISR